MKLSEISKGMKVTVASIPDYDIRSQAYKFGISEGECIICIESIRRGPVILEKDFQEIALGRKIAEGITVNA